MDNTINLLTLLIMLFLGGALYIKGRKDEGLEKFKDDFKKLSEYGKIDSKKISKDEVYKDQKW